VSTYAPKTIQDARTWVIANLHVPAASVGIVGDTAHAATGTSYHLGKANLKPTSYSIVESSRDRKGLTDAAAALDIGNFSLSLGGKTHGRATFSAWLVDQCERGAADTLDIREVIYSLDGKTVHRWDRLRKRTTGDSSHTYHTHISYFRDAESRDKTALFKRYLATISGVGMPLTTADGVTVWKTDVIPNPKQRVDAATNLTTTAAFAMGDLWRLAYENAASVKSLAGQVATLQATVAKLSVERLPADIVTQLADLLAERLKA
jgi:hypothetical protein